VLDRSEQGIKLLKRDKARRLQLFNDYSSLRELWWCSAGGGNSEEA